MPWTPPLYHSVSGALAWARRDREAPAVAVGAAVVLMLAAFAGARSLSPDLAFGAAARVLTAAIVVGVLPGLALTLAAVPGRAVTELELFGFGAALSFVLVQVVTIGALLLHWSPVTSLWIVCVAGVVGFILAWAQGQTVRVSPVRFALLAVLGVLAGFFYVQGAPYSSSEDQIHAALTRRLAFWAKPNSDGLYFLVGAEKGFYAYPFPAIHYCIALISRVADVDPLFVYHKLRAFWTPLAVSLVFLGAAAIFGESVGFVAVATAIAFVLSGTFANSYNFFWGQLTPFSHASDVALGVLLPALIVVTCRYATSTEARGRVFFGGAALALTGSLCIVHAREVVQQLVYLVALVLASLVTVADRRRQVRWMVGLLIGSVALSLAYQLWHADAAAFVSEVVAGQRVAFFNRLRTTPWFDVFIGLPTLDTPGSQLIFYGWNPVTLLLSPIVLVWFRGRLLARFVTYSILIYLLIIRFPVFTIPYMLGSYFEITVSSMRNFIFFIHMLTGVELYVLAVVISRLPRYRAPLAWIATVVLLGLTLTHGVPWWYSHLDWFYLPAVISGIAVMVWDWMRAPSPPPDPPPAGPAWALAWAGFVVVLAVWTFVPGSILASAAAVSGSPFTMEYHESVKTPVEQIALMGMCVPNPDEPLPFQPRQTEAHPVTSGVHDICPPTPAFLSWARRTIPVNAVVAASKINPYALSVFLPVRMVAWPSMTLTYHNETKALPVFYALWERSLLRHRAEPFFNAVESREEREEFLTRLDVSYVVVDPHHSATLKPALAGLADLVSIVFDQDGWVVYQVHGR